MKKKLIRIILTAVLLAGAWLVEHFTALPIVAGAACLFGPLSGYQL